MQNPTTKSELPLSVLDLVMVNAGGSPAQSMRNSLDLAQHVEKWRYKRYWLAEHHNIRGIASTATSILIGFLAGGTSSIRVGSGGIMLPNHSPLIIAEQFGTLESLYPGRIELGLGRAPGTDRFTALALRRGNVEETEDDFPNSVKELMGYFNPEEPNKMVRANPGEGLDIPIWLLGSSMFSAQLASAWGLPFAFASHFAPAYLESAVNIYREKFQPSAHMKQPYVMVAVNVFAADTDKEANRLFTSVQQMALGMIRRNHALLQPPVDNMDKMWDPLEKYAVNERLKYSFVGEHKTVKKGLESFLNRIHIDELMAVSHIYEHGARLRSFEILSTL
ncbi:MAG TPA: LLM class flavin-dependent oxidoreductase [Candidatus Nitrosocosmicus sp.]|nr:LLM class flavin-dependent oxidoreductase [Candidatus Nitrosocosmicus sp.]